MLRLPEHEAWKKTPYQIMRLFRLHKEYNGMNTTTATKGEQLAPIDIALGGF